MPFRPHRAALLALLCAAAAAAAAVPAVAGASTAAVSGDTIVVRGQGSEPNDVSVQDIAGGKVRITDKGATLTAGAGCASVTGGVECPATGKALTVSTGNG